MKFKSLLSFIIGVGAFTAVTAQCPKITCPSNITVGNDTTYCSAVVNYTLPITQDTCGSGVDTFLFTGNQQFFVVPSGINSVHIESFGAQGEGNAGTIVGGQGGMSQGDLAVTPGDTLWVYVGGQTGYNGGGQGGTYSCTQADGGNGGGASDVRVGGIALTDRVIVAGGGGGAGGNRVQGCGRGSGGGGGGGYYGGGGGAAWPYSSTTLPTGGTQTAGGSAGTSSYTSAAPNNNGSPGALGVGGAGGYEIASSQGGSGNALPGGAGGGLTGGNGQYSVNWTGQSGAGGSSYTGGVTNDQTVTGVNSGDGWVVISYTGTVTTTQIAGLPSGGTFPVGTTTNTFVASGLSGPNDTCSFTVTVIDSGQATVLAPFAQDTLCTSAPAVTLPMGTPVGGTYAGTGVTSGNFDPDSSGIGTFWVYYTDTVGCIYTDSTSITVEICAGISEASFANEIGVTPNPGQGLYTVTMSDDVETTFVEIYTLRGRKISEERLTTKVNVIDITNQPDGVYLMKLTRSGESMTVRLIKE